VTELLSAPDLVLVNLETTIAERSVGRALSKTYTFKSPPSTVDLLVAAGIDGVQLANNHIEDFGDQALLRTLELLDEGGVPHAGAGPDIESAYSAEFFDVSGWRIGFVAFSRIPCGWSASGRNTRPEVAWTCEPFVGNTIAAVDAAAEDADLVVVMVHWGIEKNYCPEPYQHELANIWQAHGADLIIGSHPHVLQGVERIRDGWLVNSTGNFAFPSARGVSASSAFFEFTISTEGTSLRVTPISIRSGRPHIANETTGARIIRDLSSYSFGVAFDDQGMAVPTHEVGRCGVLPPIPPLSDPLLPIT
jgi:poly-gamma-glutamate synthesis protein (capsule biosynthesis protein)